MELNQTDIVRAATNDPALADTVFKLGELDIKVVDLPYKDYLVFVSKLQPMFDALFGRIADAMGAQTSVPTPSSLVRYCGTELPELAQIICKQSYPGITAEEVIAQGKTPFRLATLVLLQIQQNKMISEFADFFGQILPLVGQTKALIESMTEGTL